MSQFFSDKYRKYHGQETAATVEKDVACSACGYNLRGLRQRDMCPECGLPVRDSGAPDPVKLEPQYLTRIQHGFLVILPGWAMLVLPWCVWIFGALRGTTAPAAALGSVFALVGITMVTTLRPDEADRFRTWKNRKTITRALATVAAILTIVAAALAFVGAVPWIRELAVIAWCGAQGTLCIVACHLARDVHEDSLASKLWGLAFFNYIVSPIGIYIGVITVQVNMWSCIGGLIAPMAVLAAQIAFAWFCWRLSRTYGWSLRYQDEIAQKAERLQARMAAARARRPLTESAS